LLTIRNEANDLSRSQVDIAHEVLIHRWDKLQDWLKSNTEERQLREEFQRDAENWAKPGKRLPALKTQRDYLSWIERKKPPLTEAQKNFVTTMRKSVRWWRRVQVALVAGSLLVAAVMGVLSMWAINERTKAQIALNEVEVTLATELVRSV